MFFGFYAIMAGLTGEFERGAMAIIAAGIFDGLDGRVARATGAVSAFGKEYDSLADFLSFGIAPAVLVYQFALIPLHRMGWAAAFLFSVCGALRLARFNVQHYQQEERISNRYFTGLPIPAAAAILAGLILFQINLGAEPVLKSGTTLTEPWNWVTLIMVYFLAIMMVSTIRFRSFKDMHWHRQRPFLALVVAVVFLAVATVHPEATLFFVGCGYLISVLHSHQEYRRLLAEGKEEEEDEVKDLTV
ncbi:MAG: CDP-diacylglycerol--serine O-phosphatidyltransferase [Magnetococcales bacterium]|nr:CDP-diacylglycerol--serine O-phosphatidyltransferase [Magnetococcales bacterium]